MGVVEGGVGGEWWRVGWGERGGTCSGQVESMAGEPGHQSQAVGSLKALNPGVTQSALYPGRTTSGTLEGKIQAGGKGGRGGRRLLLGATKGKTDWHRTSGPGEHVLLLGGNQTRAARPPTGAAPGPVL